MSFIMSSNHMTGTRSQQVGVFNITLILGLALLPISVHAQYVEWANSAGGSAPFIDVGHDIAIDDAGNSYVTGDFSRSATFGPFTLTTEGLNVGFIAKYDNSGTILWAHPVAIPLTPSSSLRSASIGISVDAAGNSYVVGFYEGTVTIGPFTLTSTACAHSFVAKYDSGGNVLWAQSNGGTGCDIAFDIALDESGNLHIVGSHANTITIGSFVLNSTGSDDVYVAKLDSSGTVLWAQSFGGADRDGIRSISVDNIGNSYITGQFLDTATFGSFLLTSAGGGDIFVAKLSSTGDVIWAQSAGGTTGSLDDWGHDIAVDFAGNSYVVGQYNNEATFGSFTLASLGSLNSDIFVAKYDSSGNVLWAQSAGGPSGDSAGGIAVDSNGNSYVVGHYSAMASFGDFDLNSTGVSDIFVAKYDSRGNVIWIQSAGGPRTDQAYGIAIDSAGKSYVTGLYQDTATFGAFMLTSAGISNIFVAKFGAPPLAPPTLAASPHNHPKQKYISIDASTNGSRLLAIKITETTTGKVKWAGAPFNGPDIDSISALSSAPVIMDWSAFSVLHLTGCIIQPFGAYEITFVEDPGGPAELVSVILPASTTCAWGDFQPFPGPCDPGLGDIIESININTGFNSSTFPPVHGDSLGDVMDGALGIGDIISAINSVTVAAGTPLGYTPLIDCP